MARGAIEYDEQVVVGVGLGKLFEEDLQTSTVIPGQIETEALSRCGLDRRIQVGPLVGALDDVGRSASPRTVSPPMPVDEAKTRFVEEQDLQWLVLRLSASDPPYPTGEVFLKASWSWGYSFSCRGLPVLSFTFRRLRSWPTPSG